RPFGRQQLVCDIGQFFHQRTRLLPVRNRLECLKKEVSVCFAAEERCRELREVDRLIPASGGELRVRAAVGEDLKCIKIVLKAEIFHSPCSQLVGGLCQFSRCSALGRK